MQLCECRRMFFYWLVVVEILFSCRRIQQQQQQEAQQSFRVATAFHFPDYPTIHRRSLLIGVTSSATSLVVLMDPTTGLACKKANALLLVPFMVPSITDRRRQLELCLVNLLRLQYWATQVSTKLTVQYENEEETMKLAYLEARLGSKVIVAPQKKIGGGANVNVLMLKGLQLKECLTDLRSYVDGSYKKKLSGYTDELLESLASIVEFDGLETTQDASPPSSLTVKMFNGKKGVYVQRMLAERVVPLTDDILRLFGPDAKAQSAAFVREYYPNEVPLSLHQPKKPSSEDEESEVTTTAAIME